MSNTELYTYINTCTHFHPQCKPLNSLSLWSVYGPACYYVPFGMIYWQ